MSRLCPVSPSSDGPISPGLRRVPADFQDLLGQQEGTARLPRGHWARQGKNCLVTSVTVHGKCPSGLSRLLCPSRQCGRTMVSSERLSPPAVRPAVQGPARDCQLHGRGQEGAEDRRPGPGTALHYTNTLHILTC